MTSGKSALNGPVIYLYQIEMTLLYLPLICFPHSSLSSPPAHRIDPVIDKSLDLLFDNHFISLDPTHILPLVTTWITEHLGG